MEEQKKSHQQNLGHCTLHLFYSEANARRISNSFKIFSLFSLDKKISCQLRILPIYYLSFYLLFFFSQMHFFLQNFHIFNWRYRICYKKEKKYMEESSV